MRADPPAGEAGEEGEEVAPRLAAVGWQERVAAMVRERAGGGVPGRVSRVDNVSCNVVTADGEISAVAAPLPVTGDWVMLQPGEDGDRATLTAILPRWSTLARGRGRDGLDQQVLAANIDLVLVVVGLDRGIRGRRLEREVLLAWDSGAQPLVVLTKSDQHPDPAEAVRQAREVAPDVEILVVSSATGEGVIEVANRIGRATAVLLGESGAGKSSLVNALMGIEVMATGAVRTTDRKGRHTTTSRNLLALPTGGVIIDAPGVRALGLSTGEGLASAYADIEELSAGCRFRDCHHEVEPGCAVVAAVAAGTLDAERFAGFRRMRDEIDRLDALAEERSNAERSRGSRPDGNGGRRAGPVTNRRPTKRRP